jgi:hypothetical protein
MSLTLVQWVYLLGSPPALAMPIYYHCTNRWYTSKEGRLFMLMMLLPFALYAATVLFLLVEQTVLRDVIRLVLVLLASLGSWSTLVVYRMIRKEGLTARTPRAKKTKS